jgi:hypothetical protein
VEPPFKVANFSGDRLLSPARHGRLRIVDQIVEMIFRHFHLPFVDVVPAEGAMQDGLSGVTHCASYRRAVSAYGLGSRRLRLAGSICPSDRGHWSSLRLLGLLRRGQADLDQLPGRGAFAGDALPIPVIGDLLSQICRQREDALYREFGVVVFHRFYI